MGFWSKNNVSRMLPSLTAAGRTLRDSRLSMLDKKSSNLARWQSYAWEAYDQVGELRSVVNNVARSASKAKLLLAKYPALATDDPIEIDEEDPNAELLRSIFDSFGGGRIGQAKLISRLLINLQIVGDSWVVGIPSSIVRYVNQSHRHKERYERKYEDGLSRILHTDYPSLSPELDEIPYPNPLDQGEELIWRVMGVEEVTLFTDEEGGDVVSLSLPDLLINEADEATLEIPTDEVVLIRIRQTHPRSWAESDSMTRAALPILSVLTGLTKYSNALIDSRLAGSGVLFVPQSASDAFYAATPSLSTADDDETQVMGTDVFLDELTSTMATAIQDRDSAASMVPFTATVPDDVVDKFNLMSFASELDKEIIPLTETIIKRLALAFDIPPEALLGTSGMNHWGGFLIHEEMIKIYIEPALTQICDEITLQYLQPKLAHLASSYTAERPNGSPTNSSVKFQGSPEDYVLWFDTSPLVDRPNKSAEALELFDRGVLSANKLLAQLGLDDEDKLSSEDAAKKIVIQLVKDVPALIFEPGPSDLIKRLTQALDGEETPAESLPGNLEKSASQVSDKPSTPTNSPSKPPVQTKANLPR